MALQAPQMVIFWLEGVRILITPPRFLFINGKNLGRQYTSTPPYSHPCYWHTLHIFSLTIRVLLHCFLSKGARGGHVLLYAHVWYEYTQNMYSPIDVLNQNICRYGLNSIVVAVANFCFAPSAPN